MKRLFMVLMVVAVAVAFTSVATAEKSVVSIVQCTDKADLKLLAMDFWWNLSKSQEQTTEQYARTGEYARVEWSQASERVWYKYVKEAVDLAGGLPIKKGDTVLIKPNIVLTV